ncbi:CoA ester lyase [Alcaligenaceae bacterium CGII-47]|nr:CoA ester lyase [Alcaligenaceae bacterium CGII-47]
MSEQLRSALFVPATRSDRFAKALASGADAVIIDLEDAVEHEAKERARAELSNFSMTHPAASFLVRINDGATAWFEEDLALCRELPNVVGIVLPKTESAEQVYAVVGAGKRVIPLIETARGVQVLDEIASVQGVRRLSFGLLDLMLDLGVTPDTESAAIVLNQVRFQLLLRSRMHGLGAPLDSIYPDFSDPVGLGVAARQACDMGFCGMLCIHPRQIEVIHQAFLPSDQDLDWAQRVMAQVERSGTVAFKQDGRMVDLPVIERARRIVARAGG